MLIKIKVFPGSKIEKIIQKSADNFRVKIKEKPQKGKANKAVIKILALYFKISLNKIRLIRGANKRNKIFKIFK